MKRLNLLDIVRRSLPARPWVEGENIPWDEPGFSERMLREHLSQEHGLASRRLAVIDRQVAWIHDQILDRQPTRVLELACGPGLYTSRLAKLGHECVGIDYAPAAIRHAQETATAEGLACTYRLGDVRSTPYGNGFGLVMMIYGQFNVFRREEATAILGKARAALSPGGVLLLEPQRFATVEKTGRSGTSWYSCGDGGGLFSDTPHLCLQECFWDADARAATQRFFIVDCATGEVTRHALTTEAYSEEELREGLSAAGFVDVRVFPSLVGVEVEDDSQAANLVVLGRRGGDSAS